MRYRIAGKFGGQNILRNAVFGFKFADCPSLIFLITAKRANYQKSK